VNTVLQWLLLLLLLFSTISCGKTKNVSEEPQPKVMVRETEKEETKEETNAGKSYQLETAAPSTKSTLSDPAKKPETQVFLAFNSLKRSIPMDFAIGALQDSYTSRLNEPELLAVIDEFCSSLADSKLAVSLIEERNQMILTRSLAHHIDSGAVPKKIRIGLISRESEGEASAAVRFFSREGVAEGVLYLEKLDERWFVADLQIDLQSLNERYIREDEEFVPKDYDLSIKEVF
jgi:hypothetical protein